MRRASREAWCEAARPRFYSCPGVGVAPLARSTPTLWAYAQRNAHKDTPKKLKLNFGELPFAY
ncbi:MAG: hypothetical protein NZ455_09480 [Bacteroidia bacterium]|nr:hypothetical protein [Bacteroidia bacterium]MDW8348436.1 hypothetical protein [Bacteroidia bacterium]